MYRAYGVAIISTSLVFSIGGCGRTEPTSTSSPQPLDDGDADAECVVDDACGECMQSTTLPTIGLGKVVVLCSGCGPGNCSDSDVPCSAYGTPCTVGIAPGVCAACCDGIEGRLRCVADATQALPGGASCSLNSECQSGACVPSPNSFGAGVCYSHDMTGCIKIGTPSTMPGQCGGGAVYTCGDTWPVDTLGDCSVLMTGSAGEVYYCCHSQAF